MDQAHKRQVVLGGVLVVLILMWWTSGTSERELIKQLRTGNSEQRYAAIRGLEESGSKKANKAIAEHLQDPDPTVAGRAVLALGNIGGSVNITQLEKGLSDSRPGVREASAIALGRCDPKITIDTTGLIKLLESDEATTVRIAAATALGARKATDAVPALIKALYDENPDVRRRAGAAIELISGRAFGFPVYAPPDAQDVVIKNIEDWWHQKRATGSDHKTQGQP